MSRNFWSELPSRLPLRKTNTLGFASLYLWNFHNESISDDDIDIQVYSELLNLDSRLGTSAAEQLFGGLAFSLRWDLIKV